MVNYETVTIGLEVEFLIGDEIHSGIVRYKGSVNGKSGVWVGVECKEPIGNCDGRLSGRTYFICPDGYGLFLTADLLRLSTSHRKKTKNRLYKPVKSQCDDVLFKSTMPQDYIVCINQDYLKRAQSAFEKGGYNDIFSNAPRYSTASSLVYLPKKVKKEKVLEQSFHPVSSVPASFMPDDELKIYTKNQWSYKNKDVSLPRQSNLHDTFDSFNKKRSNYIASSEP